MTADEKALCSVKPLVSVAIITYNQVEYIEQCIESVLSQEYERIQIVVGDDGSSDGTQELIKNYYERFPEKFSLAISSSNCGITGNSNKVNAQCKGKYIAWLGGDDLMLSGKISAQVEFMEAHSECNICYHDLSVVDSKIGEELYKFSEKYSPRSGNVKTIVRWGTFNGASSTMVRRSSITRGFEESIPIASDWLYWIEALIPSGTICYIDRVLGVYRRHDKNVTSCEVNESFSRGLRDVFFTLALIFQRYPTLQSEARSRMADVLRGMGRKNKSEYWVYMFASIRVAFTFKTLFCLLGYGFTLGNWRP